MGQDLSVEEVDKIFKNADLNGSGSLDLKEFSSAVEEAQGSGKGGKSGKGWGLGGGGGAGAGGTPMTEDECATLFALFDEDGNGVITTR